MTDGTSLITATTKGSNVLPVSLLQETRQQQTRCLCKHGNFSPLLPLRKMPSLIEPGCVIFLSACGILTNGHVLIGRPLNVRAHPAACACVHAVDHVKFETMKIYSQGILVNYAKICTNENFLLYSSAIATAALTRRFVVDQQEKVTQTFLCHFRL